VRSQLDDTKEEMKRMKELTDRIPEFRARAGAAETAVREAARRLKDVQESLVAAAARLVEAHAVQWTACRKRVDDGVRALALALARLDPVAQPADFAAALAQAQKTSARLARALDLGKLRVGPSASSTSEAAFQKHAAGTRAPAFAPGGAVALAVEALAEYAQFLDAVRLNQAPQGAAQGAAQGVADLRAETAQTRARLQACVDVAKAASLLASARCASSSCTSAADKAEQSLQSFIKAHGMPDVSDAAAAVAWCRLAVARSRMDRADETRGSTRAVHASLQEAYAWASEAVRGRAFPVAFASSHNRNAIAQAARAELISAWYVRASACFNDQDAAELHADYRKLLRMQ
jgi:hypothetical protein